MQAISCLIVKYVVNYSYLTAEYVTKNFPLNHMQSVFDCKELLQCGLNTIKTNQNLCLI